MIQIDNFTSQFARPSARAASGNLTVEPSTLMRQYRVTNNETGAVYRVDFYRARDGRRFVTCQCAKGQGGHVCKHAAAALSIHLQTMRASAAPVAPAPFLTPAEAPGDFSGLGDDDDPARSYRSH